MISRRTHSFLDYTMGLLQIAGPFILGYPVMSMETLVPLSFGLFIIVYSLFTRYEHAMYPIIPFRIHLVLDVMVALLLIIFCMLFEVSKLYATWGIVIALLEMLIAAITTKRRYKKSFRSRRAFFESQHYF